MKDNNGLRNILIFVSILIVFGLLYITIDKLVNKDKDEYGQFLKNYEVNEYIPTYITDEDMVKIYLNDYIYTMYSNIEDAYNLLDEEYRTKKFGSIDIYRNYVSSLNYTSYKLERYYVDQKNGYVIFGVYDTNENLFIFKTNGVMQYSVYLDDYTVEI